MLRLLKDPKRSIITAIDSCTAAACDLVRVVPAEKKRKRNIFDDVDESSETIEAAATATENSSSAANIFSSA